MSPSVYSYPTAAKHEYLNAPEAQDHNFKNHIYVDNRCP